MTPNDNPLVPTVRWSFKGDKEKAQQLRGYVYNNLFPKMGTVQPLPFQHWVRRLPGGEVISMTRIDSGAAPILMAEIFVPLKEGDIQLVGEPSFESGVIFPTVSRALQNYPIPIYITASMQDALTTGDALGVYPVGADAADYTGVSYGPDYVLISFNREEASVDGSQETEQIFYEDSLVLPGTKYLYGDAYYNSLGYKAQPNDGFWAEDARSRVPAYRWSGRMRMWAQAVASTGARDGGLRAFSSLYPPDSTGLIISDDYEFFKATVTDRVVITPLVTEGVDHYLALLRDAETPAETKERVLVRVAATLKPDTTQGAYVVQVLDSVKGRPPAYGWHWSYTDNECSILTFDAHPDGAFSTYVYRIVFTVTDGVVSAEVTTDIDGERVGLREPHWFPLELNGQWLMVNGVFLPEFGAPEYTDDVPVYLFYTQEGRQIVRYSRTGVSNYYSTSYNAGMCGSDLTDFTFDIVIAGSTGATLYKPSVGTTSLESATTIGQVTGQSGTLSPSHDWSRIWREYTPVTGTCGGVVNPTNNPSCFYAYGFNTTQHFYKSTQTIATEYYVKDAGASFVVPPENPDACYIFTSSLKTPAGPTTTIYGEGVAGSPYKVTGAPDDCPGGRPGSTGEAYFTINPGTQIIYYPTQPDDVDPNPPVESSVEYAVSAVNHSDVGTAQDLSQHEWVFWQPSYSDSSVMTKEPSLYVFETYGGVVRYCKGNDPGMKTTDAKVDGVFDGRFMFPIGWV